MPVALLYAALAIAVAGPLLLPGLVLTVDLAQTPDPGIPESYWGIPEATHVGPPSRLPLDALFAGLGEIGAVEIGQKLLLLAIVLLAGYGMHVLVPARTREAALFAGFLYAVNPFVYDRLLTGQWFLLLGYALLPHAFRWFLATLERRPPRPLAPWAFGALFFAVGIASPHMAGFLLALCAATLITWAPRIRRRRELLWPPLAGLGLGLLPSLYWLLPTPGVEDLWRHVGDEQLELYRTVGDATWGLAPAVAGLLGFWNNPDPVSDYLSVWPLFALTLIVLAAWGAILRRHEPTTWAVAAIGVGGFVLALGDASSLTSAAYHELLDRFEVLRSFREPQKGVALLAFAYAFLSVAAVDRLLEHPPTWRWGRIAVAAMLLALPLVYGFRLFGGLSGELETSEFPSSWSEAEERLEREAPTSRTLFLPFHGYLVLDFADDRVVANPAPAFFGTPILASRSVGEGAGIANESDPTERRVRDLLDGAAELASMSSCLAPLGVTHVLAADLGGGDSSAILDQTDLVPVERWDDLTLYRSRLQAGPVMAASDARSEAGGEYACADLEVVRAERRSPVGYELPDGAPPGRSLVLGLPLSEEWDAGDDEVRFEPWLTYRRNYLIGIAGAAVFLFSLVAAMRRRR